MTEPIIQIKGGAGEFEAAVVAVVLDRITREEATARQARGAGKPGLSAWLRAVQPEDHRSPRQPVWPD